jgi:hypothetical protein
MGLQAAGDREGRKNRRHFYQAETRITQSPFAVWHRPQCVRADLRNGHRGESVGEGLTDRKEKHTVFGSCKTALDYVNYAQYLQSIGYQYLAEEYRRQCPIMSGFTTWEYNEPWIDTAWGLHDNRLVRKQSFWVFKRACAPKLISARFPGYVYLPGETFRADVFFCQDIAENCSIEVDAAITDGSGKRLNEKTWKGPVDACSQSLATIECRTPELGAFFLRLSANVNGAERLENEYAFVALKKRNVGPLRMLYIGGGNYEDELTLRMLAAAGFAITRIVAGPRERLDADALEMEKFQLVALGAVFNPLTSLTPAFFPKLKSAIAESGVGFVYFGYNSTAYVSGLYDSDDIRGSALEDLLPVRFSSNCYKNSHSCNSPETPPAQAQRPSGLDRYPRIEAGDGVLASGCRGKAGYRYHRESQ